MTSTSDRLYINQALVLLGFADPDLALLCACADLQLHQKLITDSIVHAPNCVLKSKIQRIHISSHKPHTSSWTVLDAKTVKARRC